MSSAKFSKTKKSTQPHNVESLYKKETPLQREETADYLLLTKEEKIVLSEIEYQTILALITALREEKPFIVNSDKKYLTTQQAADFLNVSRPYFVKLLEEGSLPFLKVGNRRRVEFEDLLKYKNQRDSKRHEILQEFSRELNEDGLYDLDYDEVSRIISED